MSDTGRKYADRSAALAMLELVRKHRILAVQAVRQVGSWQDLDQKSRALANSIVLGTLRNLTLLDHLIRHFSSSRFPKDPRTLDILRMGLFQLLFLDRVPAHAAIDSSVHLARKTLGAGAAAYVNALLRKASTSAAAVLEGELPRHVRFSVPEWILSRVHSVFGAAAEAELEAMQTATPVTMRFRCPRQLLEAECAKWGLSPVFDDRFPDSVSFEPESHPYETALFHDQLIVPQDPASCAIVALLEPEHGTRILDLACGAGVKTLQIADRCRGGGQTLTACDLSEAKLARLSARPGLSTVATCPADATLPLPFPDGSFDRILLDAPCSGLGTIRRHPELRLWRREDELEANSRIQAAMLESAARLLAPGGRLVYSVCSFAREEGLDIVRSFLGLRSGFQALAVPESLACSGERLFMQTSASRHNSDLFFAAILQRN